MKQKDIYKIVYIQQNAVYEIYANYFSQSEIFGLIEVEDFIFNTNSLVLDPSEEKLRREFDGVKKIYIPLQSVIRVSVVSSNKVTSAKIRGLDGKTSNIHQLFPSSQGPKNN